MRPEPAGNTARAPALPPVPDRYYDRLRERVDRWLSRHAGPRYAELRNWLFIVPDVLTLVLRLAQDPRVGLLSRLKLWGVALYILAPVDVNIDFILPFGPLDDLALALAVLESVIGQTPPHVLKDNWPGQEDVLDKLRYLVRGVSSLNRLRRGGLGGLRRRG